MKAWTLIRVHVVILLLAVQGSAENTSRSEIDVFFDDVEKKIQYLISEYDKDTQYKFLLDVQKLIDDAANKHVGGFGGREENIHRVFALRLLLLNKCFNERDYTYDLNNPPLITTKVSPPLWAAEHQFIVSGMRPEDIIDPEARRQYEEAIAENNHKKDKDRREFMLQDIINRQIRLLARSLANAQDKPERQGRMWSLIEATVESQALKDRLSDAFLETIEKYNRLNQEHMKSIYAGKETELSAKEKHSNNAAANTPTLDTIPPEPEETISTIIEPEGESPANTGEGEGEVTTAQGVDIPVFNEQALPEDDGNWMFMAGILVVVFVVCVLVFVGYNRRG